VLELENFVVAVGEYYYNNKTKGIEKRSNTREKRSKTRKRGETTLTEGSSKRSIEWKVVLDPKDKALQTALALNAFVRENAISVYELVVALDTSQDITIDLEEVLRTKRDNITDEFKREVSTTKKLHREEIEKVLQIQGD